MSTDRRRTLLRTAAVTTLVSGALLVPAAGAFAADAPAPESTAPTATATPQPDKDKDAKGQDGEDRKQQDKGDKGQDRKDGEKDQGGSGTWGPVYDVTLGNGAKAEIQNRGGSYVATIVVKGKEIATLSSTHPTITYGGVKYELYPSNGHVGITYLNGKGDGKKDQKHRKDQEDQVAPEPKKGDKTVAPKGGVKAGAEGVSDGSDPAFLAAGGGMAAAGAAGLCFAMLRRGRTDG